MAGKHDLGKHPVVLFRRCQMFPWAWSTSNPLPIPSKSSCTVELFPSDLITTISHMNTYLSWDDAFDSHRHEDCYKAFSDRY